jgi:hypothetical protein
MILPLRVTCLLGVALVVGCSASSPKDTAPDDSAVCQGQPVYCAQGGPFGEGVACGDFSMKASCVDGKWTCPKGWIDDRDCTCSGLNIQHCTRCTATGWTDCADAGVDDGN